LRGGLCCGPGACGKRVRPARHIRSPRPSKTLSTRCPRRFLIDPRDLATGASALGRCATPVLRALRQPDRPGGDTCRYQAVEMRVVRGVRVRSVLGSRSRLVPGLRHLGRQCGSWRHRITAWPSTEPMARGSPRADRRGYRRGHRRGAPVRPGESTSPDRRSRGPGRNARNRGERVPER
jgi:hypothetical protein